MEPKVLILGDDDFGQAGAQMLKNAPCRLEACFADRLPSHVPRVKTLEEGCRDVAVVILAGLGSRLAELADRYGEHAQGDHVVLLNARSVQEDFELPHETLRRRSCARQIGVLGGPLHAQDLASQQHVNLVLATRFPEVRRRAQQIAAGAALTLAPSRDLVGVSVAGAYGHLTAMLTGMAQGLEWGDTSRSLLVAHALLEARALALALGAEAATFQGLVGWGELIPRASVRSDRHTVLGREVARGTPLAEALAASEQPVEGVETARLALQAGERRGVELPLTRILVEVLDGAPNPGDRFERILATPLVAE